MTVTDTSQSQEYCNTDTYITVTGTGFVSQQIFDYTLTLTGEGCSGFHATTLVHVISDTELRVGPDNFAGCRDVVYATLNYQNQGALAPVAVASRNSSCPVVLVTVTDTCASSTYCDSDQYLLLTGTGFESQQIFDYTLTLTGSGCTSLHATTLVTVISDTELRVGPDSLAGCDGFIYATLDYQNQGALAPVPIASFTDSCANSTNHEFFSSLYNGAEHLSFNVATPLALVTVSALLAYVF